MTKDQQAALEQAAREWLTQLGINREPNPSPDEREWYDDKLQVMVKALAAQRAAGLEEVANEMARHPYWSKEAEIWIKHLRQLAQEQRP